MKRRIWSILLALALSLSLGAPLLAARPLAAGNVYFTAVNDSLCPLNDSTMPFWSGGNLYLPSSVFSSYDLGLSYVRDTSAQTAILYSSNKVLEFDLARGGANNKLGTYYSASAIARHGSVYFPLSFVSSFFSLNYSVLDTALAPMVRVRSDTAVLSDSQFIDAASTLMASRYNAYEQSKKPTPTPKPDNETTTDPIAPDPPQETEEEPSKTTARILLGIRADTPQNTAAILNTLDRYGYKATFFFSPAELDGQDDLLRRIVASGHRLALALNDADMAVLQAGNEQLRRCTGTVTRMVLTDSADAVHSAGYAVYTPSLSGQSLGTTASSRAQRITRRIENASGSVKLLMDGDNISASALNLLCSTWSSGGYTVRAVTETACS